MPIRVGIIGSHIGKRRFRSLSDSKEFSQIKSIRGRPHMNTRHVSRLLLYLLLLPETPVVGLRRNEFLFFRAPNFRFLPLEMATQNTRTQSTYCHHRRGLLRTMSQKCRALYIHYADPKDQVDTLYLAQFTKKTGPDFLLRDIEFYACSREESCCCEDVHVGLSCCSFPRL